MGLGIAAIGFKFLLETPALRSIMLEATVVSLHDTTHLTLRRSVAGNDGFMGVIKPIPDDANIAMVYVTPAGIIVSVGRGFNNLFGHDIA